MPPMRIYIDRDGEPVRQPSETEAERRGFRQIEVTPTEVAVCRAAELTAERDRVANELIRLRLVTEDDPETIYHEAKQYRDALKLIAETETLRPSLMVNIAKAALEER